MSREKGNCSGKLGWMWSAPGSADPCFAQPRPRPFKLDLIYTRQEPETCHLGPYPFFEAMRDAEPQRLELPTRSFKELFEQPPSQNLIDLNNSIINGMPEEQFSGNEQDLDETTNRPSSLLEETLLPFSLASELDPTPAPETAHATPQTDFLTLGTGHLNSQKESVALQLNTPTLSKLEEESTKSVVPPVGNEPSCCSCRKTRCLKLYCECFARKGECTSACSCVQCFNTPDFRELRKLVVEETLSKNPMAFSAKFEQTTEEEALTHSRGCGCKKTGCSKKYCECYTAGVACGVLCRCSGCENHKPENAKTAPRSKRISKTKKPFIDTLVEKLRIMKQLEKLAGGEI